MSPPDDATEPLIPSAGLAKHARAEACRREGPDVRYRGMQVGSREIRGWKEGREGRNEVVLRSFEERASLSRSLQGVQEEDEDRPDF